MLNSSNPVGRASWPIGAKIAQPNQCRRTSPCGWCNLRYQPVGLLAPYLSAYGPPGLPSSTAPRCGYAAQWGRPSLFVVCLFQARHSWPCVLWLFGGNWLRSVKASGRVVLCGSPLRMGSYENTRRAPWNQGFTDTADLPTTTQLSRLFSSSWVTDPAVISCFVSYLAMDDVRKL
jgi:hypothetical protein